MKFQIYAFFILNLFLPMTARTSPEPRPSLNFHPAIVNGIPVAANDPIARSTVHLTGQYQRFSFTCTGAIIAPDLVATAAHCLGPYGAADLTVFFGVNKNQSGISYRVRRKMMSENFSVTPEFDRHDIALLLLDKPVPASYVPVAFIGPEDELFSEQLLTVAGYGINVTAMPDQGQGGMGILRAVEQTILNPHYGNTEILINLKGKGTCSGDSGGPAYLRKNGQLRLVGLASRMTAQNIVPGSKPPRYECTEEIVYTNVLKQAAWFKKAEALLRSP